MRMRRAGRVAFLAASILLGTVHGLPASAASAAAPAGALRLVVDGRRVETSPPPFIDAGRTLVPMRALFEALGASVEWDDQTRTVTARRADRRVRVTIDRRLACLSEGCLEAALLDVPARIRDDRTFVPLRFVATALGAAVRWDGATRTVRVDTAPGARSDGAGAAVRLALPADPVITGPADLRVTFAGAPPAGAAEIRWLLLDPQTGRGPIVARGTDVTGTHRWLPDPAHEGMRLLAAAVYDGSGRFLAGDVAAVRVLIRPEIALEGVSAGQRLEGAVSLTTRVNFVATHVRYDLIDPQTGAAVTLGEADPEGAFAWTPRLEQNGPRTVAATVYDRLGRATPGPAVAVEVAVPRRLNLTGLAAGKAVERPVTLGISANFTVRQVRYLLRDPATGAEEEIARRDGAGTHRWLPAPAQAGPREVLAAATDAQGREYRTAPVTVDVRGVPALFLETVGPNQVLAGDVKLRALANVPLAAIEFQLVDAATGEARTVAAGADAAAAYTWKPAEGDAGAWRLRAAGTTPAGERLLGEAVPVRVHTGRIHGPEPVVEKDRFLDLAAGLARPAHLRTGMSAALQAAQAILETGWGQFVPVDKYTGTPSNNLFGIKGRGPAGSVTSNTWEEYNGVAYRVDAAFRAYRDVSESWDDHKKLLLTASRYAPFRAVMHDGTRGAWALRRAGYATDSRYPLKLIDLMKRYDLYALDEVEP